MSLVDHHDAAAVLDEWTNRVANLPNEIAFMYEEIEQKDKQISECLAIITKHDNAIQNWVRKNGGHVANPKESGMIKITKDSFDKAQTLQSEKLALAQKCQLVVDKHIRNLDSHIKVLQDRGEFPVDAELPSLLHDPPVPPVSRPATSTSLNHNVTTVPNRQINHFAQSVVSSQTHSQQNNSPSCPVPTTSSSVGLTGRQSRESSTVGNKRQHTISSINTQSSNILYRQSSLGPGTSKTPSFSATVRAGSAGPRTQTRIGPKKLAPNGNKPSGFGRRHKKSGLSRVKRSINKSSLSPTHDSEFSDVESGSVHEEDEARTPKRVPQGDGYENMIDMIDIEDDDGVDNRKYCTCQSISYGDMVACDNPSCEFEWFHWSCVGLKSEPLGTWICTACKAAGFKK